MMSKYDDEKTKSEALAKRLFYYMKGNHDAVKFLMDLTYACHVWDDLIDKDEYRTSEEINHAFKIAFIGIQSNPFYLHYQLDLRPLILNAILQWEDANILDHGSEHDQHMAFMLRAGMLQIYNYCAYLIGGPQWAREVGPDMRRLYTENFNDYVKEMNHA